MRSIAASAPLLCKRDRARLLTVLITVAAAAPALFKPAPLHRTPQSDWPRCLIEIYIYLTQLWTFGKT
ncbi:hypothetical protein QQF64_022112 [Cirrhinus molitorella]|uniref:Secreted protein n=1 Tax=Cirrhinus molitorella TaxID=172907 RepID=A0ABR3L788_9TELE